MLTQSYRLDWQNITNKDTYPYVVMKGKLMNNNVNKFTHQKVPNQHIGHFCADNKMINLCKKISSTYIVGKNMSAENKTKVKANEITNNTDIFVPGLRGLSITELVQFITKEYTRKIIQ